MASLEEDLSDDPADALPELDELVGRMLEETGYDLDDPIALEGEEREIVAEFLAAREITRAVESGWEDVSPGDVSAAVNSYRSIFDSIVSERRAADL